MLMSTALVAACLLVTAVAWAAETLLVHASFSPDRLGAPTNLSLAAKFTTSAAGPASPITKITLYAPTGMKVDLRGAGTCSQAVLAQKGPSGCPPDSRAGFGGGVAALALPAEVIHAPYTLDFFFAPPEQGRLRLLIYVSSYQPVSMQLVLVARQVPPNRPYGLGFSVEVPPVSVFPAAPDASVESGFATLGAANVAYYKTVHGKKTLVDLRGILAPERCPRGGFPSEGTVEFADGATQTLNPTIPCPSK
jgi:hypothetical protein